MRVTELMEQKSAKPIVSFEFSRPKGEKAAARLDKALNALAELNPDYVSVTFGAGGSTRQGSYELVKKLRRELKFNVVAYLAGVGLGPTELTSILDGYQELGIGTILAIRGDTPQEDASFSPHPDALPHASDLLAFIRSRYDFCLGAGAYPEGHIEAESLDKDLEYIKHKQQSGADYLVTQYFYDNRYFFDFVEKCSALNITVPIVAGIMPIYNIKVINNLARLCGVTITDEVKSGLSLINSEDKKAINQFGIDLATQQCKELLANGVRALHFYTMNRSQSVVPIINNLRNEGLL